MTKLYVFKSFLLSSLLILSACSNDDVANNNGKGSLTVAVKANQEVLSPITKSITEEIAPSVDDFSMFVMQGDQLIESWDRFADYPQQVFYPIGTFNLKATYGAIEKEGFEQPYYEGNQTFQISDGEDTHVEITSYLANTKVSVEYTDEFKRYFKDYSAKVSSVLNTPITFSKTEQRAAFFKPSTLVVNLNVTNQHGTTSEIRAAVLENAHARYHYRFKFDVDASNAYLYVRFDEATENVPVQIDISDESLSSAPPILSLTGFESGVTKDIIEGTIGDESSYQVVLNAKSGIAQCNLRTSSASLLAKGWPEVIDLAALTTEQKTVLESLGLRIKGFGPTMDKIAIVDFTGVLPYLSYSEEAPVHTFSLEATDIFSKVTEVPAVLSVNSLDNQFEVESPLTQIGGSEFIDIPVQLLGDASNIEVFLLRQKEGVKLTTEVITTNNESHVIRAYFTPYLLKKEKLEVGYRGKKTEVNVDVTTPDFQIKVANSVDVWASQATITVVGTTEGTTEYLKDKSVSLEYTQKGANNWILPEQYKSENRVTIKGLPINVDSSASLFEVKAKLTDGTTQKESSVIEFMTEAPMQLPNAGFEDWTEAMVWKKTIFLSGGESVYAFYPNAAGGSAFWTSYNDKTTQPRGDASWFYCAYPGLVPTSKSNFTAANHLNRFDGKSYVIDTHSGSTAMEISTVGWGKNNWTSESSASAEYKQAGLLYIGTYDRASQVEVHGQPFSSRPSALEFYYKYYPLNEEQGKATIILEDESHQEIGRGELRVGDTQSFTQAVVPVVYNVNKKAAFLRVEFISTDAKAPATIAVQGSKGAWNAGYGDSRHIGSILTIDDVKLIY